MGWIRNRIRKVIRQELQAQTWTRTQECRNCKSAIPVSHRVCGFCGVPVHLSSAQEQVAEMETTQVAIVSHRPIRVKREKHPLLYDYLATKNTAQTTEPIRIVNS